MTINSQVKGFIERHRVEYLRKIASPDTSQSEKEIAQAQLNLIEELDTLCRGRGRY